MVSISASALNSRNTSPALPRRLALAANCVSAPSTGLAMPSGTRLCRKYCCSAPWNLANIGKAENSASITVTSGTSAISVVKVRLLAVMPRRSSRKRWRSVRAVSNQGQVRSVCSSVASWSVPFCHRPLRIVMLAMMPA